MRDVSLNSDWLIWRAPHGECCSDAGQSVQCAEVHRAAYAPREGDGVTECRQTWALGRAGGHSRRKTRPNSISTARGCSRGYTGGGGGGDVGRAGHDLAWRLRRAERLQSAVFATVYRENANDVVLWPKHGLPIQPGPGEDDVVLGQVVMTDFARAQVLDRLLVHERRIESSLYRTMRGLRREREARAAGGPEGVPHSEPGPGGELRKDATEVTEGHREERGGEGKNAATREPLVCSPGSCPPGSVPSVGSVAKTPISALDLQSGLSADQKPATAGEIGFVLTQNGVARSFKFEVSSVKRGRATFRATALTSHFTLPTSNSPRSRLTAPAFTGAGSVRTGRSTESLLRLRFKGFPCRGHVAGRSESRIFGVVLRATAGYH